MTAVGEDAPQEAISLKAGAAGLELSAAGRTASSIGTTLYDLLSPFTHSLGFVGDQLAVARRSSAIKAAAKAKKLLKDEGIVSGDIPPKIFLPWLDGVSSEDEANETLLDAWAGLLARAVKSSDAANLSYIDTLKKIGKTEADLLSFLATDTAPFYSSKFYASTERHGFNSENTMLMGAFQRADLLETSDSLRIFFDEIGVQFMYRVIYFSLDEDRWITTPFFDKNEHAISNLEHLGLINIKNGTFPTQARSYRVVWFQITKFAFDMFWACQGKATGGEHEFFTRQSAQMASET